MARLWAQAADEARRTREQRSAIGRIYHQAFIFIVPLQELHTVGVVSLTAVLEMTTPGGRALADMLAVFAKIERDIPRDGVKAGIARGVSERGLAAGLIIRRASVRPIPPIQGIAKL